MELPGLYRGGAEAGRAGGGGLRTGSRWPDLRISRASELAGRARQGEKAMAESQAPPTSGGVVTEQIPRENWDQFLNAFTELNAEMPVRIQVVAPRGVQP